MVNTCEDSGYVELKTLKKIRAWGFGEVLSVASPGLPFYPLTASLELGEEREEARWRNCSTHFPGKLRSLWARWTEDPNLKLNFRIKTPVPQPS